MMRLSVMQRPSVATPSTAVSSVMRPARSAVRFSRSPVRTAAEHLTQPLAGRRHAAMYNIRRPATVPLQYVCHRTAVRRHSHSPVHGSSLQCSPSSSRRLLHSCRQAMLKGLPQRLSKQPGSISSLQTMRPAAAASSSGASQSVDDDDEGDTGVTRELERYEAERFKQMSRHLDLMWRVGKKPAPAPCDCCEGSGSRNCRYCNSTGAMMVGHERFCSLEQGCKPCPICNGTGEVKCSHCQGTGYRAGWLERGCPIEQ